MSAFKTIEYALVSKMAKKYPSSFSTPITEHNCFYSDSARFLLFEFNESEEYKKDDFEVFENHTIFRKIEPQYVNSHHFRVTLDAGANLQIKAFASKAFDSETIIRSAAESGFFNRNLLHMYALRWSHLCREEIKLQLESIVVLNCNGDSVIEAVSLLNYFEKVFPTLLSVVECNHKAMNGMDFCC